MILLPIERGWRATVHLRGGAEIEFSGANVTSRETGDDLVQLGVQDGRGTFPFYLRLSDVSAVETRRVWRYRPMAPWEWAVWTGVAAVILMATRLL